MQATSARRGRAELFFLLGYNFCRGKRRASFAPSFVLSQEVDVVVVVVVVFDDVDVVL